MVLYTDPAEITDPPTDVDVVVGNTAELSCGAFGIPNATFTWSKPGVDNLAMAEDDRISVTSVISEGSSQLTITDAQLSDTDEYTCTVDNGVENVIGATQQASATITILSAYAMT